MDNIWATFYSIIWSHCSFCLQTFLLSLFAVPKFCVLHVSSRYLLYLNLPNCSHHRIFFTVCLCFCLSVSTFAKIVSFVRTMLCKTNCIGTYLPTYLPTYLLAQFIWDSKSFAAKLSKISFYLKKIFFICTMNAVLHFEPNNPPFNIFSDASLAFHFTLFQLSSLFAKIFFAISFKVKVLNYQIMNGRLLG